MRKFSVTFERYFPHDGGEDICEADERGFVIKDVSLRDAVSLGLEYRDPFDAISSCYTRGIAVCK